MIYLNIIKSKIKFQYNNNVNFPTEYKVSIELANKLHSLYKIINLIAGLYI